MSNGYCANHVYILEDKQIRNVCPKCYRVLMDVLKTENMSIEEFAEAMQIDDDVPEVVETAYTSLIASFHANTGLDILLDYHNPDMGDIYDDISGSFWLVENATTLTAAAIKFQEQYGAIKDAFFVTFG